MVAKVFLAILAFSPQKAELKAKIICAGYFFFDNILVTTVDVTAGAFFHSFPPFPHHPTMYIFLIDFVKITQKIPAII